MKPIEIWADSKSSSRCSGATCDAGIIWARVVKSGARMCFDEPVTIVSERADEASGRKIQTVDLDRNHWATCPDRDSFRRGKK